MRDKRRPLLQVPQLDVKHVGVVRAALRNHRQFQLPLLGQGLECLVIPLPGVQAVLVDLVRVLQLRPEIGGVQFTGQVAVPKVHPGVLVHLSPEKLGAVGALLPEDLGALIILGPVDDQGAALPHGVVFRLMEGVAAKVADGPQRPSLVRAHNRLRGVLHHQQPVPPGDVHHGVHLTGHPGVVHHGDDAGAVRNGRLDLCLVDVHRVGADIHEHQLCPGQYRGGRRAGEGKAGEDHLVPRPQAAQEEGHIQRRGPAGGQKDLLGGKALLQPGVALFGKGTVAADLTAADRLRDIALLSSAVRSPIKKNHRITSYTRMVSLLYTSSARDGSGEKSGVAQMVCTI